MQSVDKNNIEAFSVGVGQEDGDINLTIEDGVYKYY